MSVENVMFVESRYSVYETLQIVLGDFLTEFVINPHNDLVSRFYYATSDKGEFSFTKYEEHPRSDRRQRLGFSPNIYITSDLDDFMEVIRLSFVNRVYNNPDWNIAMLQLDGYVDLLKVGSEIKLNKVKGFWTEQRLSQVQFPYTFDELITDL